ncbi:ABC transporter ATP-binding protein [Pseudosulfitobacter pseudonitzschiae]|uniref:ABC transporter ATP-binding protein n=1 Tax=Pseudosulfitobacter pseudonitzschiae TaxID=1402135 RepID=UPI001CD66F17|nr:ABC transporter ATP-binding protein [Pseudosulfitobacter pseudonitzschiae]MCI2217180.1 ABC transporter ATP-binding protein [Pseudosulfitobacter pseudonitzschiae]UFE82549.1 ABC transporter ATP-binding protein [Pseudosulfitobacter pseudonitzschiae]UFE87132.1 ABC transporter ATP-binding protein [Pseudosulfitobacter pseudonitzschiae]UFF10657.1 ABC transporter ATP-binding protein [Pseudosulfitobacter pseudonitzschiae]UFF99645.1 ABC transporter ATP-binding protein [Pseudosulfitobacter pseudonitzs
MKETKEKPVLSLNNVKSRYGRIEALHGVSLEVDEGEVVAVIGANGAGKTTMMRSISGVQPTSDGTILFDGKPLDKVPAHKRINLGIAQVPEGRHIFGPLSVEDNLLIGGWSLTSTERADPSRLGWAYDTFPILKEKRHLPAGSLSGGQQQMLAIGRAMMVRPRLILLDEPSMGLSPLLVQQILDTLRELKKQGITILLVEQNANAALAFVDRAYVMETGNVIIEGTAKEISANPKVREAYLGL